MAVRIRYERELLLHLKDSPLCVKPKDLPPKEEWMGYVTLVHSFQDHRLMLTIG